MSGDHGLRSSLPAAAKAIAEIPHLKLTLLGQKQAMLDECQRRAIDPSQFTLVDVPDVIGMDESPAVALRKKQDSSMYKAIELLRDGQVEGVVSAGNTGALVALSRFLLERSPGIRRPAMCAPLPGDGGDTYMLDLGANVDCKAEELVQFAEMGSALVTCLKGIEAPRVALLNIGEEASKGTELVRQTAELLAAEPSLNYIGFIEGFDLFTHKADVIVCDGFVGNIALKVCEGTASYISRQLKGRFRRSWYGLISGLFVQPLLKNFKDDINPDEYNGAALLGLSGVVVKSHGGSSKKSFYSAIRHAAKAAEQDLPRRIAQQLTLT
ncbi:glycerol-3-phosphate acyltransferase PlsX [Litorivivens lipolytica]|uniref:Phosphate acyltransferase n=2 Tax=Litorivivens lipolytica TaxID=1524264 RepID=A0A7W4W459_9GAMM|nr:glycerol-3-phosphate acyltransferase PlsX [Litorivivens lipolytica]